MPLHLLGKKSWNVYNPESIARVRRDEAAAKLRDEEQERRKRNLDAEQRLELLRSGGAEEIVQVRPSQEHSISPDKRNCRKRRKLAGENDTDWEMRMVRDDANKTAERPLTDSRGHISLVSGPDSKATDKPNPAQEEQGMRLIDAAGFKKGSESPWYSRSGPDEPVERAAQGLDRWGNESPGRQRREQQRLTASDPLMIMKKGVKQLKENEKQRRDWIVQRERDLVEVEHLARRKHHKERHRAQHDDIDDFSLDAPVDVENDRESRRHRHRDREHRHHRHRSKRRDRSRSRSPAQAHIGHHRDRMRSKSS